MKIKMIDKDSVFIYKNDPYRFLIFLLYVSYSFALGMQLNPYSSIQSALSLAYQITPAEILATFIAFVVGKIVFSAFAGYLVDKIGLKRGILFGLFLALIGFFLRFQIAVHFIYAILGQLLLGASVSTMISCQLKFLYDWFHPNGRGFYCTILATSIIIGGGVGLVFMFFFVKDQELNVNEIESGLLKFNLLNILLCAFFIVMHIVFFFDQPREGYGRMKRGVDYLLEMDEIINEIESQNQSDISIRGKIETLFKQKKFRKNLILYSFFTSLNILLNATINPILDAFDIFGENKVILVLMIFLSGVSGSFFFFKVLMPKPNNKNLYFIIIFIGLVFAIASAVSLEMRLPFVLTLIFFSTFGFCFLLAIPVMIEYMIREVVDVPLPFIKGIMLFIAQSFGCCVLGINGFFSWYFGKMVKFEAYLSMGLIFLIYVSVLITMKFYKS